MRPTDIHMNRRRFEELLVRRSSRRNLILGGAAVGAVSLSGRPTRLIAQDTMGTPVPDLSTSGPGATPAPGSFGATPFSLGVASGDPLPDGIVLWTRLAVTPRDGGGMDNVPYEVRWELASDERFSLMVQSGTAVASPALAHSVHVDVTGLTPTTEYFYRFMVGSEISPVGRTRTAPAAGSNVEAIRFAFTSCAHWEHGYFRPYAHIGEQRYDVVFNLGDYLYEMGPGDYSVYEDEAPRRFSGGSLLDLSLFRNRHALYKTDIDLQAAHQSAPWVVTWDDHEVENDYAGLIREDPNDQTGFPDLVAAAYQAYYEHMPLRASSMPQGPNMQLYRRIQWGNLAEFQVLDGRQYRSDQPCGEGTYVRCPASYDPSTTMLGPDQERWLLGNLENSTSTWNVLAQQTQMVNLEQGAGEDEEFYNDSWPGYPEARNRILSHVMSRGIENLTVMTGDIHCHWANNLLADWQDAGSQVLGTEFICSSITAGGAEDVSDFFREYVNDENPGVRWFDGRHGGYTSVEATPDRWTAEFWQVDDMRDENTPISVINTVVTEAGNPGIQQG